jgi:hypothetical protein
VAAIRRAATHVASDAGKVELSEEFGFMIFGPPCPSRGLIWSCCTNGFSPTVKCSPDADDLDTLWDQGRLQMVPWIVARAPPEAVKQVAQVASDHLGAEVGEYPSRTLPVSPDAVASVR